MIEQNNSVATSDLAQLMLMSDGGEDAFRGAFLLIAQGGSRDWRWYDADLFDDLDHMKEFIVQLLRSKYGIGSCMMMLCTVGASGLIDIPAAEAS